VAERFEELILQASGALGLDARCALELEQGLQLME
jgi:hypothetical protein